MDIAIAALLLTSASTITPAEIENTPAFVTEISPLGTTGLKFVPSAINKAVSVFVPIVKSSPVTVRSPATVRLPLSCILKASFAVLPPNIVLITKSTFSFSGSTYVTTASILAPVSIFPEAVSISNFIPTPILFAGVPLL